MKYLDKKNNFNLIRLFACLQVLILHSLSFYSIGSDTWFYKTLWLFPGVIIFFAISGFLIIQSFENSSNRNFCRNRFLRIYPALFVNVFISVIILAYFDILHLNIDLLKYLIAQCTLFQFYVPESIKQFGLGHPNGALWTISIEVQFYISLFTLGNLTNWRNKNLLFKNTTIALLIALSFYINYYANQFLETESLTYKLLFNSIFYHFSFFGIGILIWLNFNKINIFLENKAKYWALLLSLLIFIILFYNIPIRRYQFDSLSILYLSLLILTVFSLVFSKKHITNFLIGKIDISYGTYLYHCLIINLFLELLIPAKFIIAIYIFSIICGHLSWTLVEKRFQIRKI